MTSENKAPERIYFQPEFAQKYVAKLSPRRARIPATEYVRADLFEASAAMASRQNALIDTLRDELAKARSPFNPPKGQIDANLWFWRCRAEMLEEVSVKRLEEAKAMRDAAMKATRNAEREVEAMGRTISKLQEKLAAYEVKT